MKRKKDAWALMRTSIAFLKDREGVWRSRRIAECERILEIDKKDRLAVVKMKKKRFGIKKISKEENLRLGVRKEERLEIARAKENLWRHHRGPKDRDLEEEEEVAWRKLQEGIETLEEGDGEWIEEEDRVERMPKIKIRIEKPKIEIERRKCSLESMRGRQELQDKEESGVRKRIKDMEKRIVEKPEEDTDKKSEEMKREVGEKTQEDKVPEDSADKVDKVTEAEMRKSEKSPVNVQYLKGQRDRIFMDKNKIIQDTNIVKSLVSKYEQGVSSKSDRMPGSWLSDCQLGSPHKRIKLDKCRTFEHQNPPESPARQRRQQRWPGTPGRLKGQARTPRTLRRPPETANELPALTRGDSTLCDTREVSIQSWWTACTGRSNARPTLLPSSGALSTWKPQWMPSQPCHPGMPGEAWEPGEGLGIGREEGDDHSGGGRNIYPPALVLEDSHLEPAPAPSSARQSPSSRCPSQLQAPVQEKKKPGRPEKDETDERRSYKKKKEDPNKTPEHFVPKVENSPYSRREDSLQDILDGVPLESSIGLSSVTPSSSPTKSTSTSERSFINLPCTGVYKEAVQGAGGIYSNNICKTLHGSEMCRLAGQFTSGGIVQRRLGSRDDAKLSQSERKLEIREYMTSLPSLTKSQGTTSARNGYLGSSTDHSH